LRPTFSFSLAWQSSVIVCELDFAVIADNAIKRLKLKKKSGLRLFLLDGTELTSHSDLISLLTNGTHILFTQGAAYTPMLQSVTAEEALEGDQHQEKMSTSTDPALIIPHQVRTCSRQPMVSTRRLASTLIS